MLNCERWDSSSVIKRMMGRSVIRGAMATLMPAFILCARVSDITSASKGPGAMPAESPKIAPAIKKEIMFYYVRTVNYLFLIDN